MPRRGSLPGEKRQRAHRKTKKRTDLAVRLARCLVPIEMIADQIGISKPTLLKYYGDDMRKARLSIIEATGFKMVRRALKGDGDFRAQSLILRTHGGWVPGAADEETGGEDAGGGGGGAGVLVAPGTVSVEDWLTAERDRNATKSAPDAL